MRFASPTQQIPILENGGSNPLFKNFIQYFRSWRNWITQQIPILENGGSNPFERAKTDKFKLVGLYFSIKPHFLTFYKIFIIISI